MSAFAPFLRLELAEARQSRWLWFAALVYGVLFAAFVWLGLRESSVLGFTGMSKVVRNVAGALVVVLPLVALVATVQSIVRARTSGYFELFLTQPAPRGAWFFAMLTARLLVLLAPLAGLLVVALVVAFASGLPGDVVLVVLSTFGVAMALCLAFVGVGTWLSTTAISAERALVRALLVWLVASAVHDFALIALLLRYRLSPPLVFGLAAANPLEMARLAILSSVDPELSIFGPVGFWMANSLGKALTLAVGIAWPLCIGVASIALARRRFGRIDLVA